MYLTSKIASMLYEQQLISISNKESYQELLFIGKSQLGFQTLLPMEFPGYL
jgi:hypothetical protein